MSANLSFQTGPLTWVKPEIDVALERVGASLARYFPSPEASEELAAARGSLREAIGALSMIGMEGLARFMTEVDSVLEDLGTRRVAPTGAIQALLERAVSTVTQYLTDVARGEPDQPMSLMPTLRELARSRGRRVEDKELFYPDLSLLPPPLPGGQATSGPALVATVKLQRAAYQRGMLQWLRGSVEGLEIMVRALQEVERAQPQPHDRRLWWLAGGLVEVLLREALPADDELKKLCARIDLQMAAFAAGKDAAPETLLRDILYHLARCEPVTPRLKEIQSLYHLERYAAPPGIAGLLELDTERVGPLLQQAHEALAEAKAAWASYSTGEQKSLADFRTSAGRFRDLAADLGNHPLLELAELIKRVSMVLKAQSRERQALIAMEMATALLAAEHALERFTSLTPQIEAKVEAITGRLLNALSGRPSEAADPVLAGLGQRNDEAEPIAQVAREMQANLQHVEQVLDGYFRGTGNESQLGGLEPFLRHVIGALRMLGLEPAAELLEHCTAVVALLADRSQTPSQDEVTLLADGLSSLGFYVQALPHDGGRGAEDGGGGTGPIPFSVGPIDPGRRNLLGSRNLPRPLLLRRSQPRAPSPPPNSSREAPAFPRHSRPKPGRRPPHPPRQGISQAAMATSPTARLPETGRSWKSSSKKRGRSSRPSPKTWPPAGRGRKIGKRSRRCAAASIPSREAVGWPGLPIWARPPGPSRT
ncbi:MAG: hypothetical protein KatS3mg123_0267 [Burkholderiales bacterium]|nr:MAG: hypothetical protein KatS3mg123_0267 [Burkholderiales bacterium]